MSFEQTIRVLTTRGLQYLSELDQADSSTIGSHWNAVRRYLDTGDASDLYRFTNVEVFGWGELDRGRFFATLETDLGEIDRHAIRGDVSFESIYDEVQ